MASKLLKTCFRAAHFAQFHGIRTVTVNRFTPSIICRYVSNETRPGLQYTEEHEWLKVQGDVATVGITNFAQDQLGDVVFCELPEVGTEYEKGETCGTIESVKAVSDVFTPLTGEVTEINSNLTDEPSLINRKPFDEGWLFKIKVKNADELNELLSEDDYKKFLETMD